jgi:hypothetical protein
MVAGTALPAAADVEGNPAPAEGESASGNMSVEQAWENAREDWQELQEASGDAWNNASDEFDQSWQQLQRAMSQQEGTAGATSGGDDASGSTSSSGDILEHGKSTK